jgi:replicative DNA helicase
LPRLRDHLIETVREEALRRRTERDLERAIRRMDDRTTPIGDTLTDLRHGMASVEQGSVTRDDRATMRRIMDDVLHQIDHPEELDLGLPTLLGPLDEVLHGGMRAGEITIVAGLTGSGKSGLGTQIALGSASYVSRHRDRFPGTGDVLYFSFEMERRQLGNRCIQQLRDIRDGFEPRRGGWSSRDVDRARDAATVLRGLPIQLLTDTPATPSAVYAEIERQVFLDARPPLVVIDHMHLMHTDDRSGRTDEIAQVIRELKGMAGRFHIPLLVLAQLNRESTKRDNARPRSSDLKNSSDIEQAASTVVMIHRPEQQAASESSDLSLQRLPQEAQLYVTKNRDGLSPMLKMTWVGRRYLFVPDPAWQAPWSEYDAPAIFEWPDLSETAATAAPPPKSDPEVVVEMLREIHATTGRRVTRRDLQDAARRMGRDWSSAWADWWVGKAIDRVLVPYGHVRREEAAGKGGLHWTYWLPDFTGGQADTTGDAPDEIDLTDDILF